MDRLDSGVDNRTRVAACSVCVCAAGVTGDSSQLRQDTTVKPCGGVAGHSV